MDPMLCFCPSSTATPSDALFGLKPQPEAAAPSSSSGRRVGTRRCRQTTGTVATLHACICSTGLSHRAHEPDFGRSRTSLLNEGSPAPIWAVLPADGTSLLSFAASPSERMPGREVLCMLDACMRTSRGDILVCALAEISVVACCEGTMPSMWPPAGTPLHCWTQPSL